MKFTGPGATQREKARYREVERLFHEKLDDEEIGARLELSESGVRRIRSKLGLKRSPYRPLLPPNPGKPRLDREFIQRAYEESDKTRTVEQIVTPIAQQLKCSNRVVERILQDELKIMPKRRDRTPPPAEAVARAKEMLEDGTPYHEVARTTGVKYDYLRHHFPGLGVRKEDHWEYIQAKKLEAVVGL